MKERPMIFNEMVRAILDGRKTQTRRPIKPQPYLNSAGMLARKCSGCLKNGERTAEHVLAAHCPYGQPGDRLWVRETFALLRQDNCLWTGAPTVAPLEFRNPIFRADFSERDAYLHGGWNPSIHMPRWASRITLEIVAVRVERVQDISEADARAEGIIESDLGRIASHALQIYGGECRSPAELQFFDLWRSIYGTTDYAWTINPRVWAIEFGRVEQ